MTPFPAAGPFRISNAVAPIAMLSDADAFAPGAEGTARVRIDIAADGRIVSVTGMETDAAAASGPEVDLGGRMVWTRLADIHAHLDKAHTWHRAPNPDGTFDSAKRAAKADRQTPWREDDVRRRMDFALRASLAHGVRTIRTHLDSQPGRTEPTWRVFDGLRKEWADRIALQAVADLGVAKLIGPYGDEVAALAANYGAALGPVVYPSETIEAEIARAFDLAEAFDLELDIHVDETLGLSANGLKCIAETALARGFKRRIVCGHACSLSTKTPEEFAEIMELVKAAGIGIVTLPLTNLYLQDRHPVHAPRLRGLAPVREIAAAGAPVAIGGDNTRDPFYPYGDHDMVEVFRDGARIAHLDTPLGRWTHTVASAPERMMGIAEPAEIGAGRVADLIVFSYGSFGEALSRLGAPRTILAGGRVIDAPLPDYAELEV